MAQRVGVIGREPLGLENDVALSGLTTLGVGGPAKLFASVASLEALGEVLAWARGQSLAVWVLGGGSNMLVSDRGFDGLVVRLSANRIDFEGANVRADAGASFDDLVAASALRGLAGLECLSGIPGLVGAVPIQNVGAYGQEVSEVISDVVAIDRATGERVVFTAEACRFSYRDSVFKREMRDRYVIGSVTFSLRPGGAPSLRYPELGRHFAASGASEPSLSEVRSAVIALRRSKSMVLDPLDENWRSAGSFFTNPIVVAGEVEHVVERARRLGVIGEGESMPAFAAGEGRTKLSAGWLIERAGFAKGTSRGSVGLSTRHALAIVNRGGARASEIVAFAREIRDGVLAAFGVRLVPEPELVGFEAGELGDLIIASP